MVIQKTPDLISINFLPQDPMVSKPELVQVDKVQFGDNLSGPRLRTQDSIGVARADANGNYLYELGTPEFDQVNTHGIVSRALATYERYTGHVMPWSFKGPLEVNPHAGEGKTAYYSRWDQSINFFQWDSPSLGKTVKTSQAFDVGSHEIGHAILDGIRPGLLSGTEGKAFHEGFGDSSAIIHALQYDTNLQQILVDNGGDFSKPSLITRLAEEFGTAFNKEDDNPNNDDHPYYRTALNEFKYQDPKTLPSDSYPPSQPEEVLTSEPHSFSRIWSGTFYSMLGALYNQCAGSAPSQLDALRQAREVLGTVWGHSLDHLPAANLKFRHVASGVLREAAVLEDGKFFDSLAAVMLDRNLLTQQQIDECHQGPKADVRLSAFPQTRAGAEDMLEGLGRGAEGWKADLALPGADGRRVYTFRAPQRVDLDLGARGPAFVQADAGLTLVFDAQGQLVSETHTPLEADDRADLQRDARALADSGQLVGEDGIGPARLVARTGPPEVQFLPVWKD